MLKKNKGLLIITSIVILLPMALGMIFWDQLPQTVDIHWGLDGEADGRSGKLIPVVALPCLMLALHWFCAFFTAKDPQNREQNLKLFRLVLWIVPVLTLFVSCVIYFSASGHAMNMVTLTPALLGGLFVVIGNYIPKAKQNSTLGVKVSWTLSSEENWYATHRVAGKIWVIGGILLVLSILLPLKWMIYFMFAVILVLVLTPIIYSYCYYRRQVQAGTAPEKIQSPYGKKAKIASPLLLGVVAALVCFLMFTGSIEMNFGEDSFTISATYYQSLTVSYDKIEEIEYRESWDHGIRVSGFGSARLLLGTFEQEELGTYTSYAYTGDHGSVILTNQGEKLVITGQSAQETKAIYDALMEKLP